MATRRRTTGRPTTSGRRHAAARAGRCRCRACASASRLRWRARSSGSCCSCSGAVLLIALALPGDGRLTDWVRDAIVPFFGAGRYLLPFVLLLSGWYVEWGPGKEIGAPWGRTLLGIAVAYIGTPRRDPAHRVLAGRRRHRRPDRGVPRAGARRGRRRPGPAAGPRGVRGPVRPDGDRAPARVRHAAAAAPRAAHVGREGRDQHAQRRTDEAEPPTGPGTAVGPGKGAPVDGRAGRLAKGAAVVGQRRPATGPDRHLGRGRHAATHRHPGRRAEPDPDVGHVRARPRRGLLPSRRRSARSTSGCARCATPTTSPTRAIRRRPGSASSTSCPPTSLLDDIALPIEAGGERGRAPAQRGDHRPQARGLQHPGPDHRPQRRTGRHPVRGPAGGRHQGQPHRGPRRRPRDGPRRPLAPHRGADPGQERGRHRDPEQGLQHRRPAADPRGGRLHRVGLEADVRARSRRGRHGPGGRPRQDAAPADRRRHRLGQERHGQRAHREPAVRGDAGRHPDDPDGPQAGRARRLQRPAPPARAGHHRARAGQGRAQVGRQRDGGPLPAAGRGHRPQHQGLQRDPGRSRRTGCPTSSSSSTSSPT